MHDKGQTHGHMTIGITNLILKNLASFASIMLSYLKLYHSKISNTGVYRAT